MAGFQKIRLFEDENRLFQRGFCLKNAQTSDRGQSSFQGPKKGGFKKGRVGLSKRLAFFTFFLPQGVPHTKMKNQMDQIDSNN